MDFFDNRYYRINKRLQFYLGIWPLQTQNERNFYRTTTVLFMGSLIVPQMIKLATCLGDIYGMIECFPILCIHLRSITKLINSSIKATEMKKLTNRIKDDWTMRIDEFDEAILRRYAERGRLLTVVYTVYIYSAMVMYFSIPLILITLDVVVPLSKPRERIFLFQTEYFVDQDKNYFYILFHAYISMPFSLGVIVAYDTMLTIYVQHACCIFATVGARLKRIGNNANNNELEMCKDPVKLRDEAYDEIVASIKMHNEAIEMTTLIESSTCISVLFVLGASMFTITITGFMAVTTLDQPSDTMQYVLIVIGELIHLFYLCWQGQVLMEHSEDIFMNAYNVNWFAISPRAKKLLILIMLRSLKPCKLTSGKVFVLSLENFAESLKTSMSYFTVLLSMQ